MSGIPVVVVERFGLPVKAVEGRAPVMTVSPYGLGIPIVLSEWGAPFIVEGLVPPLNPPGPINDLSVLSTTTSTIALAFTDAAHATSHEYQLSGGGWLALDPSKVIDSLPPDTSFDVQVRGVNADGNGPPSNTVQAQTQPIPIPVPVNTAVPAITGIEQVGEELTATTGTWTNSPTGYAYQWQFYDGGWMNITGATSSTYVLQPEDEGLAVRVSVVATNAGGGSDPAYSEPTDPIAPAIPDLGALSLSDDTVAEGSPVTIDILGATAGSTITVQSGALPDGLTLNSGARTISGTPTVVDEFSFTLRETLAGSSNSPRDTALDITVSAITPADYIVTNNTEWNAVFANDAATLSGKIVEIQGDDFTGLVINNKDIAAEGDPLIIRCADEDSALVHITWSNGVTGIHFNGVNFQMTGWPSNHTCNIQINNGTYDDIEFNDCTFRHGYGPTHEDFDMTEQYPEYERVDNVFTATTTSTTYELDWLDPAMTNGWIEFFNRGAQPVRVAVGGSGVTATLSSPLAAAGQRTRFSVNPTTDTHIAIITASGSSQVNARTEIGMTAYLARAFASASTADVRTISFNRCRFRDLSDAIKGVGEPVLSVIMDCDFDRIYQDVINCPPRPDIGVGYRLRNLSSVAFSRHGIAENLNGDARDPHGDEDQSQATGGVGIDTMGPIYSAGNRTRRTPRRTGVISQGKFWSDNDIDPSYDMVYSINDALLGGAVNGICAGEAGYPVGNVLVYGATVLDTTNLAGGVSSVRLLTDGNYTVYVGHTIAQAFMAEGAPYERDNTLRMADATSASAVFPNFSDLPSATTREAIDDALTAAAEGVGLGSSATVDAVDWITSDYESVIRWENIPSGVHWSALNDADVDAVITLPPRKVLNRKADQTIVPGSGVEWQSLEADGETVDQAWTSSPGTVQPDQFVQARITSSDEGFSSVNMDLTVNGFLQRCVITTAAIVPSAFLVSANPSGYFVDPSNVPANTSRITFSGRFKFPSLSSAFRLFTQASTGCDLEFIISGGGIFRATVEDGTGAAMLSVAQFTGSGISADVWYDITFDVDQAAETAKLTIDDITYSLDFTASGNGVFQSNRAVSFLGMAGGTQLVPAGTQFADLSVSFNSVLHKAISNTAMTANADSWKQGADFTQGP